MKFKEFKKKLNLPKDTIAEKFYDAIVDFRIKEGLTKEKLAVEIGVDIEGTLEDSSEISCVRKPCECVTFYYKNKIKSLV